LNFGIAANPQNEGKRSELLITASIQSISVGIQSSIGKLFRTVAVGPSHLSLAA
jgi:hypothetical protein